MNKSYIVKGHIIAELIALLMLLAALGIAIYGAFTIDHDILVRYGTDKAASYGSPKSLLSLPIIMLITGIGMILINHLVPAKYWNMPFKAKPGRENLLMQNCVSMSVTMVVMMAMFTLGSTILMYQEKVGDVLIASFMLVFFMFAGIIFWMIKMARDNKA